MIFDFGWNLEQKCETIDVIPNLTELNKTLDEVSIWIENGENAKG